MLTLTLSFGVIFGAVALVGIFLAVQEIRVILLQKKLSDAVFGTEKRNIQLSYLIKASHTLSSALSKDKLLRLIIETFGEITKSDKNPSLCALYLMDYNVNRFVYTTGFNMDVTMLNKPGFSIDESPFKELKKNGEIRFFDEKENLKNVFFKENKLHVLKDIEFALFIPLIVENEAMGAIISFMAKSSFQFLEKDISLLKVVTGQASIALGSAVQSELAVLDRLTKIYNHTYFEGRLEQEVARSERYKYPVSFLMIDIDHFKRINDTYGHQQGDSLLKEVAQAIKLNIRIVDLCARYGGEEFAVILPETDLVDTSEKKDKKKLDEIGGALQKADHLRKAIEETWVSAMDGSHINITVSIGIGVKRFPEGAGMTKEQLIKEADKQLYKAKQEGRNKVCYSRNSAPQGR